ncbi:hypothetical protein HID58_092217 [Brassica napus]|uniref:Protein DEK n=1 Tax=Brassica napus TaxID=3708 RepID=A0ABQ7WZF3_BRANA|nr:hypothetical protein HID58_092217 [Brassica napus]
MHETTTPEVKSPAKDEIGAGDEEGNVSKNSSVTQSSSERPTRERKKVERFSLPSPTRAIPNKSVSIEKGLGTPLREIPNVAHQLSKRKADGNLILLHTILYGKKAKAQMIKKNISQFSGFVWSEEEEEKQRAKVKEKLDKCIKEKLIFFCDVLDIPINRSHIKKVKVAFKVLEFLESPKATRDVILADQEKRKRQAKKGDHPSDKEVGKDEGDSDSEDSKDTHEEDATAPEEEDSDHEKTETEEERISSGTKDSKNSGGSSLVTFAVCNKHSGDHFGVDLLHRKKEVKGVITDAISEMSDVEDEESEAGSEKEKEEEVKAEAGSDKEKAEDHEKLED